MEFYKIKFNLGICLFNNFCLNLSGLRDEMIHEEKCELRFKSFKSRCWTLKNKSRKAHGIRNSERMLINIFDVDVDRLGISRATLFPSVSHETETLPSLPPCVILISPINPVFVFNFEIFALLSHSEHKYCSTLAQEFSLPIIEPTETTKLCARKQYVCRLSFRPGTVLGAPIRLLFMALCS